MINNNVEYTSIDELAKELKELSKKGYGDYPVCINGVSPVFISSRPWYYDGGYLVKDASGDNYDFLRSRPRDKRGNGSKSPRPGVKDFCFDIDCCNPTMDDEATIDGRKTRWIDTETWTFLDKIEQQEFKDFGGIVKYKMSPTYDEELKCHPMTAYLDSGESEIGKSCHEARENLKAKIKNQQST